MRLDDPELVRREYADETRFAVRRAAWDSAEGTNPRDLAVSAVAEVAPEVVLEVGCGSGELADRIAREVGTRVVALDVSERMVELARRPGVDAHLGKVQELPFADGSFDCVLAAWMLYHVPDRERALSEVRRVLRPRGRFVVITNAATSLEELWRLLGAAGFRDHPFSRENGSAQLARYFGRVERHDVEGTVTFTDRAAARAYVAASTSRAHLADELPSFEGPLRATRIVAVFIAERAA